MKNVMVLITVFVVAGAFTVVAAEKELDPAPTGPGSVPEATGGPDLFGYTWADQASGCTYQWVDISATGTDLGDGDDVTFPVTLGIGAVDYYGTPYADWHAGTNGHFSLASGSDLSNDCPLPNANGSEGMAVMNDDLDVDPSCTDCAVYHQYFAVCPRPNDQGSATATGCDVIQWQAQHYPGGTGPATEFFEVIIYETRDFVMQVEACTECGDSSTTGIENEAADDGLTYACDVGASIGTGTAVCFSHPNPVPVDLMSFDIK